jgi:hypothetical protein
MAFGEDRLVMKIKKVRVATYPPSQLTCARAAVLPLTAGLHALLAVCK